MNLSAPYSRRNKPATNEAVLKRRPSVVAILPRVKGACEFGGGSLRQQKSTRTQQDLYMINHGRKVRVGGAGGRAAAGGGGGGGRGGGGGGAGGGGKGRGRARRPRRGAGRGGPGGRGPPHR